MAMIDIDQAVINHGQFPRPGLHSKVAGALGAFVAMGQAFCRDRLFDRQGFFDNALSVSVRLVKIENEITR